MGASSRQGKPALVSSREGALPLPLLRRPPLACRHHESLGLIIATLGVKTSAVMKTPYRRFAFIILAVIAIVTFPSCSPKRVADYDYECPTDQTFYLQFGKPPTPTTDTQYVEVDKTAFDNALCFLRPDQYEVEFRAAASASPTPHYTPPSCSENISTDKITTSGAVRTEPAEESAYDPNAVYHVKSNNLRKIQNVLNALRQPTPTPTPP